MGLFKDADEVYQFLGEIFKMGVNDPELGPKFKKVGAVIKLDYTDPPAIISVDFGNGVVEFGPDSNLVPEVEMQMTADTAHRFWLGKVNVAMAMAKGQIRTKGSMPKVMKIVPITRPLFASYDKLLRDAGRVDLIEAAQ